MTDSFVPAAWRVIWSAPDGGATNMAMDEAILHAVAQGRSRPTLRFYAWKPPCLSLGRGQKMADVDLPSLEAAGFDLVRRPTGGKAILHVDELTYSVIAPKTDPRVTGSVIESYRRLSTGLVQGLDLLGVTGIAADRRTSSHGKTVRDRGAVCFEVPSDYEITAGGRKLIGSAQMRARGVVLQHGSVPLCGDIARICPLLTGRPDPDRVRGRATTVAEALGHPITWDEVAEALAAGFAGALNLHLEPGTLSDEERAQVRELAAKKYGTEKWTRSV